MHQNYSEYSDTALPLFCRSIDSHDSVRNSLSLSHGVFNFHTIRLRPHTQRFISSLHKTKLK